MIKIHFLSLLFFISCYCLAQTRLDKLVIEPNEKYSLDKATDILVVDTLVMKDSSSILLNTLKKENFIHAKEVFIGNHCSIIGRGISGKSGKAGVVGAVGLSPCRNGATGADAVSGLPGGDAINVSLYFTNLNISGSLIIDMNGGDGGNGGRGGKGGDGGSGTRMCLGGNGGNGGNGANGGAGGRGGTVNINCKKCDDLHLILGHKLIVKNFGGFGGIGGDGGQAGLAGLGVRDGKNGQKGKDGLKAAQGKTGFVNLSRD